MKALWKPRRWVTYFALCSPMLCVNALWGGGPSRLLWVLGVGWYSAASLFVWPEILEAVSGE